MARLRFNNLQGTLGASLTNVATAVTFSAALTYQQAANVPTIVAPDYIALTLEPGTANQETVWLTAYTAAATTGTIIRAQEGAGLAHANGVPFVHAFTVADVALIHSDFIVDTPNGVDDTAAILEVGVQIAGLGGGVMKFQQGTYNYTGTGLTNANVEVAGVGRGGTVIVLGASSYLLQPTVAIGYGIHVHDFTTSGGLGIVRQSYTGTDTSGGMRVIERCDFRNYTQCAICSLSVDGPYWKIRENGFLAASDAGTIGVALQGLTDTCDIESNDFRENQVHVKIGMGGNNAYLSRNGFIRFAAYTSHPRYDLWVVPNSVYVNSGAGFVVDAKNKFGPENLDATHDYRIVYADEDATGADFTTHLPLLSADSAGFITAHHISGTFYGVGVSGNNPIIYSTTPTIRGCDFDILSPDGSASPVFALRTAPPPADRTNMDNALRIRTATSFNGPLQATNAPSLFSSITDPQGAASAASASLPQPGFASNPVDYIQMMDVALRSFALLGSASLANVADAYGGIDATELTTTASASDSILATGHNAGGYVLNPSGLIPMWVEFEVHAGSSSPLTQIAIILQDNASIQYRNWYVTIPASGWVPVRLGPHYWRTIGSGGYWNLVIAPGNGIAGAAGKVQLARLRVYQSRNPILPDLSIAHAITTASAPASGGAGALPATPKGYMTVFIAGVAQQIAYY